ncbi:hypothetical protein CLOM_g16571 [Closterium sp. NIES-68]|nr:hypothetical protein CLOM_g16571 [Closterium sp. NIES-68]
MGYTTSAPRQTSRHARVSTGTQRESVRSGKERAEPRTCRDDDVSGDSYSEEEHAGTSRVDSRAGGKNGGRIGSGSSSARGKGDGRSRKDDTGRTDSRRERRSDECLDEDSTEYESNDEHTDSEDVFSENEEASTGSDDDDGSDRSLSPRSGSGRRHRRRDSDDSPRRRSGSRSPRTPESARSPRDAKSWSGSDDDASKSNRSSQSSRSSRSPDSCRKQPRDRRQNRPVAERTAGRGGDGTRRQPRDSPRRGGYERERERERDEGKGERLSPLKHPPTQQQQSHVPSHSERSHPPKQQQQQQQQQQEQVRVPLNSYRRSQSAGRSEHRDYRESNCHGEPSNEYEEKYVSRSRARASAASVDFSHRNPPGLYAQEHEHSNEQAQEQEQHHQYRQQHRQQRIAAVPLPQHKRYASAAAVPAKQRSASLSAVSLDQAAAAIAGVAGGDDPAEPIYASSAAYSGAGGGNCGAPLPGGNAAGGRTASAQARSMRKCISGDRASLAGGSMDLDRCKQGGLGIGARGGAGGAGGCNAPRPSGNQPGNQQGVQPLRQNVRPSAIGRSMSVPDDELERTAPGGGYQQHQGQGHSHGQGYMHGQMNGQPEYAYRQPGPGKLQMKALRRAQSGRLDSSNRAANNGSPSTSSSTSGSRRSAMPRSMSARAPSPNPPFLPNGLIDLYPAEPLSPREIQTPVGAPPERREFPALPMLDIPWCSADSPRSPPKPINVGPPLRPCSLGQASAAAQQVRAGGRIGMKSGQGMGASGREGGGGRGGGRAA